jgi:D-alanine-D-alanine ligase
VKRKKVAVICGGFSEEQEPSRDSGNYVAAVLCKLGHIVSVIEYSDSLIENIEKASPDVIFPLVQGKYHGDGTIQALLERIKIPYIGSRSQGAAIINHKTECKRIWRSAGILTPDYFEYSCDEYANDSFRDFADKVNEKGMSLPVVVKPPTQGNRYGMVFVKDKESFDLVRESFRYDDVLLVEAYVEGRFFTQGILEIAGVMTALPPVEVLDGSNDEFKMFAGGSSVRAHDLTPEQTEEVTGITLFAATLTGASGFARIDYHLSGGKLYILEINAVPGLVPGYSSMNECAAAAGYSYEGFVEILLETAK